MKSYFIHNGTSQTGPYTIEELALQNLSPETNIWADGFSYWIQAKNIEELKHLFKTIPPPFHRTTPAPPPLFVNKAPKKKYNNPLLATVGGAAILIIAAIYFINKSNKSNAEIPSGVTMVQSTSTTDTTSVTTAVAPDTATMVNAYSNVVTTDTNAFMSASPEYASSKSPEELRVELAQQEQANPSAYLTISSELNKNLIDENVFKGFVRNTATAANFKDIQILVTYYSETDTEIGTDNFTIYKYIGAGSAADFKVKQPGTGSNVKKYGLTIIGATPVE